MGKGYCSQTFMILNVFIKKLKNLICLSFVDCKLLNEEFSKKELNKIANTMSGRHFDLPVGLYTDVRP